MRGGGKSNSVYQPSVPMSIRASENARPARAWLRTCCIVSVNCHRADLARSPALRRPRPKPQCALVAVEHEVVPFMVLKRSAAAPWISSMGTIRTPAGDLVDDDAFASSNLFCHIPPRARSTILATLSTCGDFKIV